MLDPNEDTEWNAILREKGILPPKPVEVEEEIIAENPRDKYESMTIGELNHNIDTLEDEAVDEDEARFLEEYRRKRVAQIREVQSKERFGSLREISKADWKSEVNESGDIYVVIHIGQKGNQLCSLIDSHLRELARKFPAVKFLRGEVSLCIPNYPESNLPTLLIYYDGELKSRLIGPKVLGGKVATVDGLEWQLSRMDVLKTELTEDPAKRTQVTTHSKNTRIRNGMNNGDSADDDSDH